MEYSSYIFLLTLAMGSRMYQWELSAPSRSITQDGILFYFLFVQGLSAFVTNLQHLPDGGIETLIWLRIAIWLSLIPPLCAEKPFSMIKFTTACKRHRKWYLRQNCCVISWPDDSRLALGSGPNSFFNVLLVFWTSTRVESHLRKADLKRKTTQQHLILASYGYRMIYSPTSST